MCSSGYVLFQDNLVWFWWKLESQIQNWNFTSTVLKLKYRREYFRLSFNNIGGKIKYLTLTERNKVDKTLELQTIHQISKSQRRALLAQSLRVLVDAFNQEKALALALVGAFSVIVKPIDRLQLYKHPHFLTMHQKVIISLTHFQVWMPDTFFRNEKDAKFHDIIQPNLYVRVFPDGDVLYSIRVNTTHINTNIVSIRAVNETSRSFKVPWSEKATALSKLRIC